MSEKKKTKSKSKHPTSKPVRLDFGAGTKKKEGFIGVDIKPPADKIMNLNKIPYSFEDESVDEVHCSHLLEHLDIKFTNFLDEVYRILKPNGVLTLSLPNAYYWGERFRFLFGRAIPSYHPFHKKFLRPSDISRYLVYLGFTVKFERSCRRNPIESINRDFFSREIIINAKKMA